LETRPAWLLLLASGFRRFLLFEAYVNPKYYVAIHNIKPLLPKAEYTKNKRKGGREGYLTAKMLTGFLSNFTAATATPITTVAPTSIQSNFVVISSGIAGADAKPMVGSCSSV
jgi:hypothetical protein